MIKAFGVYECAFRRSNFYVGGLTKKTKTVQYLTPFPLWKFTSWKWKKHVVPDGYLLFFISGSTINSSACNYLFKAWRIFFWYFSPCNGLFNEMLITLLIFLPIGTYKCFRVLKTGKWSFWHSLIACRTTVVGALWYFPVFAGSHISRVTFCHFNPCGYQSGAASRNLSFEFFHSLV